MPAAYSYDLRQKVMASLQEGESVKAVAQRFKVGQTTVYEWRRLWQETGDYQARKPGSRGYGHKINDWQAFAEFVNQHRDKTQAEMAAAWDGEISQRTISRALKKIGYTRPKSRLAPKDKSRKSESLPV
jgi:transposase